MWTNLASLPQEEIEKINVDLIAASVAFKERYSIPVVAEKVEYEQPTHLKNWFRERLSIHRITSSNLSVLPLNENKEKKRRYYNQSA